MLAGVVKVHDLKGAGKFSVGDIPDPGCAVAHNHFPNSTGPAALPGFLIHSAAKLLGSFDGAGAGRHSRRVAAVLLNQS